MDNKTIIKKADEALLDLTQGGMLSPEQGNVFIRKLLDAPTILNSARKIIMNAPQLKINKIGFGERLLRPAVSGVALKRSEYGKATVGQIELNTKEVIAEVRLPYDMLEDNIERGSIDAQAGSSAGGLMDTITTLLAERASLDLEELTLLGDKTSADPYLALLDGYLRISANHNVLANSGLIPYHNIPQSLVLLPTPYLRNRKDLSFFVNGHEELNLREQLKQGVGGDAKTGLTYNNDKLYLLGLPIDIASMMPMGTGLLTLKNNLIFGIQRKINIEFDKDITTREYIIVLTVRIDAQIEEGDATVYVGDKLTKPVPTPTPAP